MQVELKNRIFTATQWFKDGDHPAVYYHKERPGLAMYSGFYIDEANEDLPTKMIPGLWIVELFDGIHVYGNDVFEELFMEYK